MMHKAPLSPPILQVEQVSLGYPGVPILDALSFDLVAGQLVFLLGANGAGKSTLLHSLSGVKKPLSGSISLAGKSLSAYTNKEKAQYLSIVFPLRQYPGHMTVYQLVALGRTPYTGWWGQLNQHDRSRVAEALTYCGISHLQARTLNQLSDGERQKASIARCLAQDTPLLLLDEPTTHLDLHSRLEIMALLRNLAHKQQKLIIVASHALDLALNLADQIALIQQDRQWVLGLPEQLVLEDQLPKAFPPHTAIAFEKASGTFRLKASSTQRLSLSGSGDEYYWTRRALQRNEWQVNKEEASYPKIWVQTGAEGIHWTLQKTSHSPASACFSLSELLRKLAQ